MADDDGDGFPVPGGRVKPGTRSDFRYTVSETYLGDPVRIPVTVLNGSRTGPTGVLTAASHGDELNGIEVVRRVAQTWEPEAIGGTIVCLPVLNVPGFLAQQRYLPILDRDLNRSFPGSETGTSADRMASRIYSNFIEPSDFVLDFHTSTRGRNNMLHVRADMDIPTVERLARAFASHLIIDSDGTSGTLRRSATDDGIPAIVIEMGEAHRFESALIDSAVEGIESVLAEFGMLTTETVRWPGWRTIISDEHSKTWIRADAGGLVDMHYQRGSLVYEDEPICTITNPFMTETEVIRAPFTGLLVGVLENPVVYPGNPLCHLVELDPTVRTVIEASPGPV